MRSTFDFKDLFKTARFSTLQQAYAKSAWFRAGVFLAAYALWNMIGQTVFLTLVALFPGQSSSRLHEISETYSNNQINFLAITAAVFTLGSQMLNPMNASTRIQALFPLDLIRSNLSRGLGRGLLLGGALLTAFLLSKTHRLVGVLIQPEDGFFQATSIIVRMISLLALVYFEEYLFRVRILLPLQSVAKPWTASAITSVAYCLIKGIQLHASTMMLISLFLLSFYLSIRFLKSNDENFVWGAGFLCGLLVLFQPILSLPLFGTEFPGFFMMKYMYSQLPDSETSGPALSYVRLVTGGVAGPLPSIAFQLILAFDLLKRWFLWQSSPSKG